MNARKLLGENIYSLIAPVYRNFFWNYKKTADLVLESAPIQASILEVGGGNGQFADALLESGAHKNVRVCIVDIAEEIGSLVAESRKSNLKIFPKTNINELPSEVMFQIVTIMDVIHHVQHSEVTEFLEVAFSKLESGGKMFIKDIEADTFTSYCAWLADTFISSDKPKKFWKSKDLISLVVNLSRQKIHNVNLQRLDKGNFLLTITKI